MAFSRSLIPSLLGRDWWDVWDFPRHVHDQDFGLSLLADDLLPRAHSHLAIRPRRQHSTPGNSEVHNDPNKFQVLLDVSHFLPEEISVKTVDNAIVIYGRHEEKPDQHGYISRQFTRRYMLPEDVEPATVKSSLTSDGVLIIEAPKKQLEPPPKNEREVPITLVNKAAQPSVKESGEGQQASAK